MDNFQGKFFPLKQRLTQSKVCRLHMFSMEKKEHIFFLSNEPLNDLKKNFDWNYILDPLALNKTFIPREKINNFMFL